MKSIKKFLISIIIIFCLSGCTINVNPDKYKVNNETFGVIVDKFFVPHKDFLEDVMINGKYETIERHYPDIWYFRIQRKNDKNTILQTDIMVSEEVWNNFNIGDFYGGK